MGSDTKCVLMKDGSVRKMPWAEADQLISTGQAKRFISRTIFRAMKLGVEVKNYGTKDEDGAIKKAILDARKKKEAEAHKAAAKKKKRQKELAEMAEAQEVLNAD